MMHSGKYRTDPTDSPIMLAIDDGVPIGDDGRLRATRLSIR